MTKLRHDKESYRRAMQISKTLLFIFVEGHKDRNIYDRMLSPACKEKNISYEIVSIGDIRNLSEGKNGLLVFFDYLKNNDSLVDSFGKKKMISIFYLDKDVDDLKRSKRKSEHIIYTELYEVDNYLFKHGEVISSAATACSLRFQEAKAHLKDGEEWRRKAANTWKEWVCLCVFSCIYSIICSGNYSLPKSPVNSSGGYGALDKVLYKKYILKLKRKSGLNNTQFTKILNATIKKVEKIYEKDEYDKIFKGTRYFDHLKRDMQKINIQTRYDNKDIDGKVRVALIQALDFTDEWAEYSRAPLRRMISRERIS